MGLVAYRAASDVVAKGAIFLITVMAARRLSAEGFGIFALGTTVGWIAAVASDFGLQMHLAREVARTPVAAAPLLERWLRVRIAAALVVLGTVAIAVAAGGSQAGATVMLFAIGYLASGIGEFLHYFYRGLGRSDVESTLTLMQRIGTLTCALLVLWLSPDVRVLAAAMLVPPVVTAVYSLSFARRLAGPATACPVDGAGITVTREFVRDVAPIGAGILLSALYFRIDVFLLQAWQTTEAVGLYNAVFRLIEALRLFPAALLAVTLPVLVRAQGTRPLFGISIGLTMFGVAVSALVWLAAPWLVPVLYGAPYAEAVPAFRILAAAFPLMSLNYVLTHQLIGWNGHRAYAIICLAALVFNVALNAQLIPELSTVGAAWSTLWTEALLTAACTAALALLARTKSKPRAASTAVMAPI